MAHLLPRIAPEPPAGYVAFVARHLEPLRRDAERVTGDERGADWLYPEVLTDVATRWPWFELLRTRLRRPRAAEVFLWHAFERRSQQWHAERADQADTEIQVRPVAVWSDGAAPLWPAVPRPPSSRSNAALRLAPFVAGGSRAMVGPVAEAAIAWWHAYAAHRRRAVVAGVTAAVLAFAMLYRLVGA